MNDACQDYAITCLKIVFPTPIVSNILSTIAY